jgi:hypothetical protein
MGAALEVPIVIMFMRGFIVIVFPRRREAWNWPEPWPWTFGGAAGLFRPQTLGQAFKGAGQQSWDTCDALT